MVSRLHADELPIDRRLVRGLLEVNLPAYSALPLERLRRTGSSNVLFRLGDHLLVRLPRQPGGGAGIAKEARWTPHLARSLPVTVPEVVSLGAPALGYPEQWSVVRRLPGRQPPRAAARTGFSRGARGHTWLAEDLAQLVAALRSMEVPSEARSDPALQSYRGEPLAAIDEDIRGYIDACRRVPDLDLDLDAVLTVWDDAARRPGGTGSGGSWVHGDLLAENLLARDRRLSSLLDLGTLSVGDPTVDLVAAWELLSPSERVWFRGRLDVEKDIWLRGRAWALAIAVMTFAYYWQTMPRRCASRRVMAEAVLSDAARGGRHP